MAPTRKAESREKVRSAPEQSLDFSERAVPSSVPTARHTARDFALAHGADQALAERVNLAVSEAVSNVVKYAYEPEEIGSVRMKAAIADGFLEIQVTDLGLGFRDHGPGGLGVGLSIIAEVSSDLEISQDRNGTELRMRFLLGADE
ncbi:MAG TPA: ATP-binding protein [Solirubrobacterales bacterium]|nr:ATP-binding protein [Solirubrobacterales bacterium]